MKIYIAAPYTKGDVAYNVFKAIKIADELVSKGYVPIIPHLTHFWHLVSPKPANFWYDYDLNLLDMCDALLRLDGESTGADAEVEWAEEHCIPVYYSVGELDGGQR